MLPEGPLTDRKRDEIVDALAGLMKEYKLSQADVAKGVGSSPTYINNLLTDSGNLPAATRDRLLRDINGWVDRECRARENKRPDDFVLTRVAERLIDVARRLTERADMGLCYAPAGCGKSTTIEAIVAEIPTAVAVLVDRDARSPTGLLTKIYNAVSRKKLSRRASLAEVVEKFRKPERVATHNLLILDQAHKLSDASLSMLADLHEEARCSVLLVGTVDLLKRVSSDDEPDLGQISSRVGMRINLAPELAGKAPVGGLRTIKQCFTVDDIRKLFHRGRLKLHGDAARMLCQIANGHRGTLRRVVRLYDWAETAARAKHAGEITVAHLEAAMRIVEQDVELPAGETAEASVPAEAVTA